MGAQAPAVVCMGGRLPIGQLRKQSTALYRIFAYFSVNCTDEITELFRLFCGLYGENNTTSWIRYNWKYTPGSYHQRRLL